MTWQLADAFTQKGLVYLSKEMICETLATESFANPVTRADKLTLPGASAHFKLLVSGKQMAVEMRL